MKHHFLGKIFGSSRNAKHLKKRQHVHAPGLLVALVCVAAVIGIAAIYSTNAEAGVDQNEEVSMTYQVEARTVKATPPPMAQIDVDVKTYHVEEAKTRGEIQPRPTRLAIEFKAFTEFEDDKPVAEAMAEAETESTEPDANFQPELQVAIAEAVTVLVEADPDPMHDYDYYYSQFTEAVRGVMGRMGYGEGGITPIVEEAMCYCVVFNRLMSSAAGWFSDYTYTPVGVILKPAQFDGYSADNLYPLRSQLILEKVIDQWCRMQCGATPEEVGWPLPTYVLYWTAGEAGTEHAGHNRFYYLSDGPLNGEKVYWDYTQPLADPYTALVNAALAAANTES